MTKTCSRCGESKPSEAFYTDARRRSGLSSRCKDCVKAASAIWRCANPEKDAAQKAAWQRANPEKVAVRNAAWQRANPGKVAEYALRYNRANPEKRSALVAKRNAAKKQRTPPWLNQAHFAEIDGVYHFAKVMEQITGQKYHVDHREPTQGRDVSGLHVPWNLRAIPARENCKKGNRRI